MRNIKLQVKSFDFVPRLSPKLHRKPVRKRKLQVGFNGVSGEIGAIPVTRKREKGCTVTSDRRVDCLVPEVDLEREQPKQRRAHSDKQKCASDLQGKKGEEEEKKGRGRKKKISWSVQVRGGEARSAQG